MSASDLSLLSPPGSSPAPGGPPDLLAEAEQDYLRYRLDQAQAHAGDLIEKARESGDEVLGARARLLLALCLHERFRCEEARPLFTEAAERLRERLGPTDPQSAHATSCLAVNLWTLYQPEARELARDALSAVPPEPGQKDARLYSRILRCVSEVGRTAAEGEILLRRALALAEALSPGDPLEVASVYLRLGMALNSQDDAQGALTVIERALALRRQVLGQDHLYVAFCLHHLAAAHLKLGDLVRAEEALRQTFAIAERHVGADDINLVPLLCTQAVTQVMRGERQRALSLLSRARELEERTFGPRHPRSASLYETFAILYMAERRPDQAELILRDELAAVLPLFRVRPDLLETCLQSLLKVLIEQGKNRAVLSLCDPILQQWEAESEIPPTLLTTVLLGDASASMRLGSLAKAEQHLRRALAAFEAQGGGDCSSMVPILAQLVPLLAQLGKGQEARVFKQRLDHLRSQRN